MYYFDIVIYTIMVKIETFFQRGSLSDADRDFRTRWKYILSIDRLSADVRDEIWTAVGGELSKLDTNTRGRHTYTPEEKIALARQRETTYLSQLATMRGYSGKNLKGVRGALKDVRVALEWLRCNKEEYKDFIPEVPLRENERARYRQLDALHRESFIVHAIRSHPSAQHIFSTIPHIDLLLSTFEKESSIDSMSLDLGLRQSHVPVWEFTSAIRDFLYGNELNGLYFLADRVLIAQWLKHNKNAFGKEDVQVSKAASFVLETPIPTSEPESFKALIWAMRQFLKDSMVQEYIRLKKEPAFADSKGFDQLFPGKSGLKANTWEDVDVEACYRVNQHYESYPETITDFARDIVMGRKYMDMSRDLVGVPLRKLNTRRGNIRAGKHFLTSLLLARNGAFHWDTFQFDDLSKLHELGNLIQREFREEIGLLRTQLGSKRSK
jgi:hypothetical protein